MSRTYTTDADIRAMVTETLGHAVEDFDVDGIVVGLICAAEHDGAAFVGIPEGEEFWAVAARNVVDDATVDHEHDPAVAAEQQHVKLTVLEQQLVAVRHARDENIRSAISAGVTMYALARRVGITEQAVRRIRDRG